jgi:hypothetical protein
MNEQEQNERNSLRILAVAAEEYLKGADELGKNFIGPQVRAAGEILNAVINGRWPLAEPMVPEAGAEAEIVEG